ncbi:MAG: peroxide stress protein YaaA, partial [Acutalibacteraceae bacterium]
YDFWGDELAKSLLEKEDTVINLASEEYSRCISRYPEISQRFITCIFGTFDGEKIKENGTQCKMARGEMVRFMAENKIEQPQEIKEFNRLGYQYCEKLSDERNYVFLK